MSIPWPERQLRIAEIQRQLREPQPKPRLALRVARYLIGDNYDEELFPAGMIIFLVILAAICAIPYALLNIVKRVGEVLLIVASLLLWLAAWYVIDLWQLATWPREHLRQGGGIEPEKLLKLALFALGVLICLGGFVALAIGHHFNFAEWFPPVLVLGFLYAVATGIRL